MFKIENETELKEAFRSFDQPTLEIPTHMKFPMVIRDYIAWKESSGVRTFLVVADPENRKTFGVAFRNDNGPGMTTNHCEWCHSEGGSSQIGLLTTSSSDRKKVGLHLCLDLSCLEKLESRANLVGENSRLLSRALISKIMLFVRRHLF